jgi:hypothetical protein
MFAVFEILHSQKINGPNHKTTNRFFVVISGIDIDKYMLSKAPIIKDSKKKKKEKKKAVPEQAYRVVSEKMRNGKSWGTQQRIQ